MLTSPAATLAGLATAVLLVVAPVHEVLATPEPERIAGPGRVATSVAAARSGWDRAETAVLATAGDFPDALAASTLASAHDAPLLLTRPSSLPSAVGDELERLDTGRVLVLGGDDAVSPTVVDQLAELDTSPQVERLAGGDRFATAAAIATEVGAASGSTEAVVVLGDDFPDALAAGALGLLDPAPPVLLAQSDELPDASRRALDALAVDRVTMVGGPSAIAEGVQARLDAEGYHTERLSGGDRYWTSAAVGAELESRGVAPDRVTLATGTDFPDALAAGPLAARRDALLHLVAPSQPHEPNDRLLRERADQWAGAAMLGGSQVLDEAARASLTRSLRDEPHPEPATVARSVGDIAVDTALDQLGTPYRYGATGPGAFDCSGLTSFAWRAAGVEIPRTSSQQFASLPRVAAADRQPGDLVAFGNPVHHIGIYLGDDQMVEAPHSGQHVRIGSIHRPHRRGFVRPAP